MSLNPTRIFKHEAEEEKAEIARLSSFVGAIAIGELVKSTLGPKGMDKILVGMGRNDGRVIIFYINLFSCTVIHLQTNFSLTHIQRFHAFFLQLIMNLFDSKVEVTNDGATILRAIGVDNPAAKVLVDMSKVQDDEVGDGTTSVTVLASELIREAEKLVEMKFHPQTIITGFRKACAVAKEALTNTAIDNR